MATTFYYSTDYTDITTTATTGARIVIKNVHRPLRVGYTRHKLEIPGRTGSWDFGGGVARDYMVTVDMIIIGSRSSDVMATAAAVETALNAKQEIVFSDSTDVTHTAQIFSEIQLTPEGAGNIARATIEFECDSSS